jgi:hypothetical protein
MSTEYKKVELYNVDLDGVYISTVTAKVRFENDILYLPAKAYLEQPIFEEGKIPKRVGGINGSWELITDLRGTEATEKATGNTLVIDYVGDLKPEHTLKKRKNSYQKWSKSKKNWKTDTGNKQKIIRKIKNKLNVERDELTEGYVVFKDYKIKISGSSKFDLLYLYVKARELKLTGEKNYKFDWRATKVNLSGNETDKIIKLSPDDALELLGEVSRIRTTAVFGYGSKKDALQNKTTDELIDMLP